MKGFKRHFGFDRILSAVCWPRRSS